MTQLYLIRHGIATERADHIKDETRPLTPIGREKTQKVAQRLTAMAIKFDIILTSPLLRARQTAEIFKDLDLTQQIVEANYLSPTGEIEEFIHWWRQSRYNKKTSSLALVGHQPNLGCWAETLVWGNFQGKLVVKKAGIIGLTLPEKIAPIGESELFLLTSPKWLL